MSATPTRWEVKCDWAMIDCEQKPAVIDAPSLAKVRATLRARGWRCGPWKEWSSRGHLDMCPRCVFYVRQVLREQAASR